MTGRVPMDPADVDPGLADSDTARAARANIRGRARRDLYVTSVRGVSPTSAFQLAADMTAAPTTTPRRTRRRRNGS